MHGREFQQVLNDQLSLKNITANSHTALLSDLLGEADEPKNAGLCHLLRDKTMINGKEKERLMNLIHEHYSALSGLGLYLEKLGEELDEHGCHHDLAIDWYFDQLFCEQEQ